MSNPYKKVQIVKLFAKFSDIKNKAYKSVRGLLKRPLGDDNGSLNSKEILGIWKGLFTWLLNQDKQLLQEEVITKIVSLLENEIQHDEVAIEFIKCYSLTMQREFPKINVLMKDKFLLLVREMNSGIYRWMDAHSWTNWDDILSCLLFPTLSKISVDYCRQMIDTLVDEAKDENGLNDEIRTNIAFYILLWTKDNPVESKTTQYQVANRILSKVTSGSYKVCCLSLSKKLFELGQRPNISASSRRCFYYHSEKYHNLTLDENLNNIDISNNKNEDKITNKNIILMNLDKKDVKKNEERSPKLKTVKKVLNIDANIKEQKKDNEKRKMKIKKRKSEENTKQLNNNEKLNQEKTTILATSSKENVEQMEVEEKINPHREKKSNPLVTMKEIAEQMEVEEKINPNKEKKAKLKKNKSVSFGKIYKKKITPSMMIKSFSNSSNEIKDKDLNIKESILKKKHKKIKNA